MATLLQFPSSLILRDRSSFAKDVIFLLIFNKSLYLHPLAKLEKPLHQVAGVKNKGEKTKNMKKGLLFLVTILSVGVAFAQDKPKNVNTEFVQIKLEPLRTTKTQSIKSNEIAKKEGVVGIKQKPKRKDANTMPRKAELHAVPVKKNTNKENNK